MCSFLYGATFISFTSVSVSVLCNLFWFKVAALTLTGPNSMETHIFSLSKTHFEVVFFFSLQELKHIQFLVCKKTVYPIALGALTKSSLTHLYQICSATNQ